MQVQILKTRSEDIKDFHNLFLHENNFQFVFDKCHYYGWADVFVFVYNNVQIGYGAVWGTNKREDRDTVFEFYVLPPYRSYNSIIFQQFIDATNPLYIESQSNDVLLSAMLYEFGKNIHAEAILFKDYFQSTIHIADVVFGRNKPAGGTGADIGGYFLKYHGEIVASGGFMLNYNFPYADIYMDVKENYRRRGFGSFIVQELKKEIYTTGHVPAARCNIDNPASKHTLQKAGLVPCGFRLKGTIKGKTANS